MAGHFDSSRRNFFRRKKDNALRPPWTSLEINFIDTCTRCNACIDTCETKVITRGDGGFPELNFSHAECTFCEKCADACPEAIFDKQQSSPWSLIADIQNSCLAYHGIFCQSCKDACEAEAISFALLLKQAPIPTIDTDSCTGCGACVEPCPSNSIRIFKPE
ncbi:ferredoxin-type protein NapF [Parashewanella spongiae]|uniref:Ferredoxin-type protein NapF n=1 Tax=Parashewanella spongiae TaxID=342950 RepID=A0A3A6TKQ2_9GAMM|nr:ferredoxin-type protein NapF [Parashewanella spongiae]MCL1078198.1 ferredoxin-type protein NapF [Parashewanella spongiae]RJY16393.1 ferredoxin-type protein NapF [Parashewanella spongiae]